MSHDPQTVGNAIFLIVKFLTSASAQVKNTSIQVQDITKFDKKLQKNLSKNDIKMPSNAVIPTPEQDSTNSIFYRILRKGY
jgi:hypothetical protein